jgi:uracil-DNA glycosylase family 4
MESIPIAGQAKVFAGGFGKANFGIGDSITLEKHLFVAIRDRIMNAKELFFKCVELIGEPFPTGMRGINPPNPIEGRGFFPVASGSFDNPSLTEPLKRSVMFVGQDWGCEADLESIKKDKDADIQSGTGRNLHRLIKESRLPINECFFTNALFGLRKGNNNLGQSPGWESKEFVNRCTEALRLQIKVIRPRAVICLGRQAPKILAQIFSECEPWVNAKSFGEIDQAGQAFVTIGGQSETVRILSILVHPAFRHIHVRRRCFRNAEGSMAELELLNATWEAGNCR